MSESNMVDLRKEWEQLPTPDLEAMLRAELEKTPPDDDIVLTILHILEDREEDRPLELTAGEQKAFEYYKHRVNSRRPKRRNIPRWLSVAACGVMVVGLLFTVMPQKAQAETFWEMLQRWSESLLEIVSPRDDISSLNYHFETDNPGLQQVYDAVVELGVKEPVVPMWLPDGYEIVSLDSKNTPMQKSIFACFAYNESDLVYKLDVYEGEPAHQFYRDDTHFESYEKNGTIYNITRNIDKWIVVWTKENIECSIFVDCHEDALRRILGSIYTMEEN